MTTLSCLKRLGIAAPAALACLSSPAFAQSSVQLYGLLDAGIGSFQLSGAVRDTRLESGQMTTSYWGIKGEEDLGGGFAAVFAFESFLRPDTGDSGRFPNDPFLSRNANVGIRGGFGTVRLGRATTPLFVSTLLYNPFGDSFGFSPSIRSFFGATGKVAGDTGWSNAITYSAPRIAGFSTTIQLALGEGDVSGESLGASIAYGSGPLGLSLAIQQVKATFASGDETTWQLGASYNLGLAKAFFQYGQVDEGATSTIAGTPPAAVASRTALTKDKIAQVGASIPLAGGSILASFAMADTSGAFDTSRDVLSIGYDHNLSKRTDAYAVVMSDKQESSSRGNTFAVGMRHRF